MMPDVRTAMRLRSVAVPLAAAALAIGSGARAQEQCDLTGTVLGKDGAPAPHVPVDVLGPASVFTETDGSGRFAVHVRAGTYVIRLRDGAKREQFERQVGPCGAPPSNRVDVTLRLKW